MNLYEAHHFYAPFFLIKLDGEQLDTPVQRDVLQVSYHDSLDGIDTFDITLNNWDARERGQSIAKYIGPGRSEDSDLFEPGRKVEVFMGYHAARVPTSKPRIERRMLVGEITTLAVNWPASGQPSLRVSGQNILRTLLTKQATHDYEEKTDTQIAREVFSRLPAHDVQRLRVQQARERETPRTVKQDNQFDIVFMLALARHSGYDLVLEEVRSNGRSESVLFFGAFEQDRRENTFVLEWGKSLIAFQPTLTIIKQVGAVTVRGWNPDTKERIVGTATLADLDTRILNNRQREQRLQRAFERRSETVVDRPVRSENEAKKLAKAALEKLVKQTITCSGTTVGFPDLRTGVEIELQGLGPTFNGHYTLTATTHTIGSNGYQTEFQARKEERV